MRNSLAVGAVVALVAAGVLLPASASQAAPSVPADPAAASAGDGRSLGDLTTLVPVLARNLLQGDSSSESNHTVQEPADSPEGSSR
ncbi:hypothetical protein ABTY20_06570 [Streptomyces sp. NPDC126497]|uniref:hypothetical protein n=1 Tax=Streptomyces sp. NPDC126497 TaxID=3155313 RepID=UPI0033176414